MRPEPVLADLEGLRALARSLAGGGADDLLQDTALLALEHPPALDERPVGGWLRTLLRNRWRMDRRGAARRQAREHAVAIVRAADEVAEATRDAIDAARTLDRIAAALDAIDEPFRTAITRRYLDGQNATQIARALGVPAGTVRWRLKTGLARLRVALDAPHPSPPSRWQRAVAPLIGVTLKTKTVTVLVIVWLLLLGALAWWYVHRAPPAPAPALPALLTATRRPAGPPPAIAAPQPWPDRAIVEPSDAPGGALSGRVVDRATGHAIAGAELTFTSAGGALTVPARDDGSFELAPPAPGRFVLATLAAPGFLPYAPELAHSSVRVVLDAGQRVTGLTLYLSPELDSVGAVIDQAYRPVAGARVRLVGTLTGEQAIDRPASEWTTDADGHFTFQAAEGAILEATHDGQLGRLRVERRVAGDPPTIQLGTRPLDAAITGRIVDARGAPIADALVRARTSVYVALQTATFATTAADGTFALDGLDRAAYDLAIEAEGHAPARLDRIAGGRHDLAVALEDGLPLAGQVVDASGAPVPSFTLLVQHRDGPWRATVIARSLVDPSGRFAVRVPPGDYHVVASATGWAPAEREVAAGTTTARLALHAGSSVHGVVVDSASHQPIAYAQVRRDALEGGASVRPANPGTVTGPDGAFELTGVPAGHASLVIEAEGYHTKVDASLTAIDGGALGPLRFELTQVADGEHRGVDQIGLGAVLAPDGHALRVDFLWPNTSAEAAGILVGDHVTAIDGATIDALGYEAAVSRMYGGAGTTVALTLRHAGTTSDLLVPLRAYRH